MANALQTKKIRIVGAPIDLGAGRRGVDMGPSALRVAAHRRVAARAGLPGRGRRRRRGPQSRGAAARRSTPQVRDRSARWRGGGDAGREGGRDGALPLILGGDHSVAIGSTAGLARALKPGGESFGIIWFDAHADMNMPESTPSGNIHGMALAVALGLGDPALTQVAGFAPKLAAKNAVLVGTRSIDDKRARRGAQGGRPRLHHARHRRARHARRHGRSAGGGARRHARCARFARHRLHGSGSGAGHGHHGAPAGRPSARLTWPWRWSPTPASCLSMDVTEINPVLDEHNQTARLAVDLTLSALGKRVY